MVKDNVYLSFLLFISDYKQYKTTFSLNFQTRQQVSFSQTPWYHSLHWLHSVILYLLSVGGTYDTRHTQYISTFEVVVTHLTTSPVSLRNGVGV